MRHPTISTLILGLTVAAASCASSKGATGPTEEPIPESRGNPFLNVAFFLNPDYTATIEAAAQRHPEMADAIRRVAQNPTAVWLDSIKALEKLPHWLDEAKKQQDANGKPTLTIVSVYNLPDRDCSAIASSGELKIDENGEERYRKEFIDPIAAQFKAHPDQPIVVVLENDSLANLATNMAISGCRKAKKAYEEGITYAIKSFYLPNVSIYLDVAHAGWLGWEDNRARMGSVLRNVVMNAGGVHMIRGFATNTCNFTHLTNRDGAALEPSNPCPNELTYVKLMREMLKMYGFRDHGFIVDTSRNGKGGIRAQWGSWCNVRGAGIGERPRPIPVPRVDAYVWMKPPGESDGTSGADAAIGAPQAGQFFDSYFIDLVQNAKPPM